MQITVEGMEFYAYHGYYEEENRIGCRYTVDLTIDLDDQSGSDDLLTHTVNYEELYRIVSREMETRSKLIEHVAARIRAAVLARFPEISHLRLALYKYNPPLGGQVARVGILLDS